MGPHAQLDRDRSPARRRRITLGLTLEQASRLTQGQLSVTAIARMETTSLGSERAWAVLADALGVAVEALRPRSSWLLGGQLILPALATSS